MAFTVGVRVKTHQEDTLNSCDVDAETHTDCKGEYMVIYTF